MMPNKPKSGNKFFHVHNEGNNAKSHWIIATDKKDATRIASTQSGKVKKVEELTPIENIHDLIKTGKTGLLARQMPAISGAEFVANVFGKTKKEISKWESKQAVIKNPWFFYIEV